MTPSPSPASAARLGVGRNAETEDDQVGPDRALIGDDRPLLDALDPLTEQDRDALLPAGGGDERPHVRVETAHQLRAPLDHRHLGVPFDERLGELEADVAPPDHRDPPGPTRAHRVQQDGGILEGLDPVHVGQLASGDRQPLGDRPRGDMQQVEAQLERSPVDPVVDFDVAGGDIDADRLVLGAHVDAMPVPELLGCAGDELVEREHVAADEIRDAARRVTGPPALFHHDDLEVGTPAPGLRRRAHAGRVTADHDQAFGHLRSLSQAQRQHWRRAVRLAGLSAMMASWPCKSIAVIT